MFSAVYFFNLKGDILIQRLYRDDIDRSLPTAFRTHVLNVRGADTAAALTPVRLLGSVSFLYFKQNDVYILFVTKQNANAMLAMSFMKQLVALFTAYFAEFSESAIKNNFVLIYELLDETMDFGWPQMADPAILKQYIFQKGFITESARQKREDKAAQSTLQVTGAVGWRREGIKYKKNEVFLDIVEEVHTLMSQKGEVLRSEVVGRMVMKAFLTGMPDVKIGLNDKVEDVKFHQCVNLARFNAEKVVSFVPPDGEFELMNYRTSDNIHLPFRVLPSITEPSRTRVEIQLRVSSTYELKVFAINTIINIPVPEQTASADIQQSVGKAKYDAKRNAIVWKIKRFNGAQEHTLGASVDLVTTTRDRKAWARPPIQMSFQVPMYSASGLRVQYLRVWEKSNAKVDKWVRKVCKAGDFSVRT